MAQLISRRSHSFRMHVQSEPSLGRSGAPLLAVPRALLRAIGRAWKTHSDQRLLQELSDHQLRDIGISRHQIPHVIATGWDI